MIRQITVREVIHHGDYRNDREQVIDATWQGFVWLLDQSPYNAKTNPNHYAKNVYAAKLFADLLTNGRGSLGWANYEVVSVHER